MKLKHFYLLFLPILSLLLFSVLFSNIAEGWAHSISEYYFYITAIFLALFVFMVNYRCAAIQKFNTIDILIILSAVYILIRQLFMGISYLFNDFTYTLSILFLLYFSFRISLLNQPENKGIVFLIAIALCSIVEIIIGTFQIIRCLNNDGKILVTGSFTNPGVYGTYLSVSVPSLFFFGHLLQRKFIRVKKTIQLLIIVFSSLAICLLLLSGSRAAIVAGTTAVLLIYGNKWYTDFIKPLKNNRIILVYIWSINSFRRSLAL